MEQRLFDKLKKLTSKKRRRPVEDIHRSMDIVEFILHEAEDFGVLIPTVTYALRHMKENPKLDISDAIVLGYEDCTK